MPTPADQLKSLDLTVYSAGWCPDCRRFDAWLSENKVGHKKVLIDQDESAAAYLEAQTGKRAIPFVLVNGKAWVRGYHKEHPMRFSPELFVTEALAAANG